MNRKLRNILWSVLLFLLCMPLGFMGMIISKPHTPHKDYLLISIGVGIAIFLLFGIISWGVYYFARRRDVKDPSKRALIVFSVLMFAGFAGNSPQLSKAIKERDKHDFLKGFRESMTKDITEGFKTNPDVPAEVKGHAEEISDCIYYKAEVNDALIEEAMTTNDPKNFALTSPVMKKIVEDCLKDYLQLK